VKIDAKICPGYYPKPLNMHLLKSVDTALAFLESSYKAVFNFLYYFSKQTPPLLFVLCSKWTTAH